MRRTGRRNRPIHCLPVRDRGSEVFAVAQLLNRKDGKPFDAREERRFGEFTDSLGVVLETVHQLHSAQQRFAP